MGSVAMTKFSAVPATIRFRVVRAMTTCGVAVASMLSISLVGLAVSFMIPFQPLQIYSILLNAILILAYVWILVFNSDEI